MIVPFCYFLSFIPSHVRAGFSAERVRHIFRGKRDGNQGIIRACKT